MSGDSGEADDGDLGFLVALAGGGGEAHGQVNRRAARADAPQHALDGPDRPAIEDRCEDPELQELVALAQAGQPPRRAYDQRSWQLLEVARSAKALKRTQAGLEQEQAKNRRLEAVASVVAVEFPAVAAVVGLQPRRQAMNEGRALVQLKLAMLPAVRHDAKHIKVQARAVGAVAACIRQSQEELIRTLFFCDSRRP